MHKTDINNVEKLRFYLGPRGDSFKELIKTMLRRGKLKDKYIDSILDEESMKIYSNAFTSNTITSKDIGGKIVEDLNSKDNYEVYEKLGDGVFDNFIGWYSYRRFPDLNDVKGVKVLHIIRSKYGSKAEFSPIAERCGFFPFISASVYKRTHEKKPLLEDVFEAFLGATSYILDKKFTNGIGYAICYDILKSIFDEIEIKPDFEELVDHVTKLDQLFMRNRSTLGKLSYQDHRGTDKLYYVDVYGTRPNGFTSLLGQGVAALKKDAKQKAAKMALVTLGV